MPIPHYFHRILLQTSGEAVSVVPIPHYTPDAFLSRPASSWRMSYYTHYPIVNTNDNTHTKLIFLPRSCQSSISSSVRIEGLYLRLYLQPPHANPTLFHPNSLNVLDGRHVLPSIVIIVVRIEDPNCVYSLWTRMH